MKLAHIFVHSIRGANMLIKLKGGNKQQYGQSIQKMDHNIQQTGLFTDNNLIRAIDMHPPELMDIHTVKTHQLCERGNASSFELLEAVKRGILRITLREMHTLTTPHGRLIKHMHKAFARHMGLMTFNRTGDLFIAPQQAELPYRFNLDDTAVWNLRGRQRIYIYPDKAPYIHMKDIQAAARFNRATAIAYHPGFEANRIAIDVDPGELIFWPHLTPYRVEDLEGLSAGLLLKNVTFQSRARIGAHYFDDFINQRFGKSFSSKNPKPAIAFMKALIALIINRSTSSDTPEPAVKPSLRLNLGKSA